MSFVEPAPFFNCFICTREMRMHKKVVLGKCQHELCEDCVHEIMIMSFRQNCLSISPFGPRCPFCRDVFLFGLSRLRDIDITGYIHKIWIDMRKHGKQRQLSFFVVCNNVQCEERFLVNRKCGCTDRARYVYFHRQEKFLAYM